MADDPRKALLAKIHAACAFGTPSSAVTHEILDGVQALMARVDELTALVPPQMFQTVEHATRTKGGTMHVRPNHPDVESNYPLETWIQHQLRDGGKVYQRTIVVLFDWTEVDGA